MLPPTMQREGIGRAIAKRESEAVQAHPPDDESSVCRDEPRAAQQRWNAVHGALMVRGVRGARC
jgi:hypothetical protein